MKPIYVKDEIAYRLFDEVLYWQDLTDGFIYEGNWERVNFETKDEFQSEILNDIYYDLMRKED
jgi:hypothetical protein